MARAALDAAVEYANERKSFGVELVQHQAVAFRLADMATRLRLQDNWSYMQQRLKMQDYHA